MTTEPVVIAVIGWGNFFGHIHEQTVADLVAEGVVRLQAVCVRSPDRRAAIMARVPAAYGTADADDVFNDPEIDAVLIGAPQAVQARYSIDAIKAGKYVYCEKPFFCEEEDPRAFLDELAVIGPDARQRLAVGLNKRFAPAYRELRDLCRDQWGGIRHLQFTVIDDAWRWGGKYPAGFLLWLDLCHWLDLGRWFTGAEVAKLSCLSPQDEDSQVTMQMTDGSVVSILLSGNGTMDMMKEECQVITRGRRSARVVDYVEMEIFGGVEREVRSYQGNQQAGGDPALTQQITDGGMAAFRAIRREVFDRFQETRDADPKGDARVQVNIPNFMRPQGWNEAVREFITAVAAGEPLTEHADWHETWISYDLLETVRASLAADGQFVAAPALPAPV